MLYVLLPPGAGIGFLPSAAGIALFVGWELASRARPSPREAA